MAVILPGLRSLRPQAFTYLAFALLLVWIHRASRGRVAWLALAPPLMAVWANLHGGFVAGLGVLGVVGRCRMRSACADVRAARWRSSRRARRPRSITPTAGRSGLPRAHARPAAGDRGVAGRVARHRPGPRVSRRRGRRRDGPVPDAAAAPADRHHVDRLRRAASVHRAAASPAHRPHRPDLRRRAHRQRSAGRRPPPDRRSLGSAGRAANTGRIPPRPAPAASSGTEPRAQRSLPSARRGGAARRNLRAARPDRHVPARPAASSTSPRSIPSRPWRGSRISRRRAGRANVAVHFNWGEYVMWHAGPRVKVSMDGRRETVYSDAAYHDNTLFIDGVGEWDRLLARPSACALARRDRSGAGAGRDGRVSPDVDAPGLGTRDGERPGRAVRPARQFGHVASACDTGPCARRRYYVDLSVAAMLIASAAATLAPMTVLFASTIGLGAYLVFVVQPQVGKLVLPLLGGTPAVWNTCIVFFQLALLAGYLYAHVIGRLGLRAQAAVHLPLMLVGGRGAADDDWRGCESVDRSSGELAVLAAAGARGRAVLRAVGDRAAGAAVAVVHDASARVRSVFPLRREQRRKPARAAHVSRGDRTPPRARRAEPLVGDRLRAARRS